MSSLFQLASVSATARRPLLLVKVALMVCTAAISSSAFARTTTTSLAVTSSGIVVTSVKAGSVVTLTAIVDAGTTAVTQGQVNFCDATAAYCVDIHILGTAQLTSSGTATYKFRPGIGSHSYKAEFVGANSYARSGSSASPLTVTGTVGPFATATSIAETGAWGNYTLTGIVTEAGGTVAPTGTISFIDASNGNAVLGVGSLGVAVAGVGWPTPGSLLNTQGTYFVLVVDLNGDGVPDLVLGSNVLTIYLGKANGTYTEKTTISVQQGPTSYPFVSGDFNGDGIPDLAIPLYGQSEIAIVLGKGNGTFAAPTITSVSPSNGDLSQMLVGDFNGDGIPDLAVIDRNNSTVDILLGNGDGTFTAEANPPISGIPETFAAGDFNGDGKTDLAVQESAGTIAILLGNGDGTFAASESVNSGSTDSPIVVADFNGDGKLDIAVAAGTGGNDSMTVLTGNGDGTFNSPFSGSPTSTSVTWSQVADFNQDGAPDVVLADSIGSATVFLNNGGGSLSKSFPVVSGLNVPAYLEVGVGDLNGDGYPDIVAGGYYSSAQGLYLTEPTETASASASVQVNGVGQHLAEARFPPEGSYKSSLSSSIPLWGLLPATSTTLSLTSGGSPVTSVPPGTVVLLTAQVRVGTAPVTAGQVNFCDASAPHCTDIHILGSSALNSSGAATFEFVPGAGAHKYQAQFVEDGFGLASASNIASLNVGPAPSPVYSDTIAITYNGSQGDYSLTASVTGYGGPASPTGKISFLDTSVGNNVLATASLGTGVPGIGFLESMSPTFGSYPANEVTADFNGDGIPDLAIISTNNTISYAGPFTVAIFLGNGNGTFRAGPTIQPTGMQNYPFMICGDFNGDGKPDLAILSYDGYSTSYLTILLDNGDGSFSAKPTVVVFAQGVTGGDVILGTMATADFNGDGKLDLAVVGDYVSSGGVTILLGNGDGTFTAAGPNLDPSGDFALIATGDFNGDGIPDFVIPNYFEFGGSPTIFLGKGDGTFTFKSTSFTLDYFPTSVVVGDFNGDGVLDLAFSDLNGVEIALGNGDGTFTETSASPIAVPSELYSLRIGDFNHDGKLDLAGLDNYFDQIVILLGAGDGTFSVTKATPGVNASFDAPHQLAAADFNGDAVPDLALLTYAVNTASILLTVPTETATATANGIAPVEAGTHNVDASYAGDSHYGAVTSGTIPLTGGLAPLEVSPNSLSFGNEVVGTTSPAKTVTLKNTGTVTLEIGSITPSGDFAIFANTCGATLAGKKNCKVSITFTPTALGKLTGMLTITDNTVNSPQTVPLLGTGVEPAMLTPASAIYGKQNVGTTSAAKTFTLTNNQAAALTSIAISTTGNFAASATTCGMSLVANGKCTISVTFTPTATGTRTGQLVVNDSAVNSPQTSNLNGMGK